MPSGPARHVVRHLRDMVGSHHQAARPLAPLHRRPFRLVTVGLSLLHHSRPAVRRCPGERSFRPGIARKRRGGSPQLSAPLAFARLACPAWFGISQKTLSPISRGAPRAPHALPTSGSGCVNRTKYGLALKYDRASHGGSKVSSSGTQNLRSACIQPFYGFLQHPFSILIGPH
jgi:hypothetical protein